MVYKRIYLIGDVHGMWSSIASHIDMIKKSGQDSMLYIQVGDFNIGFSSMESEMKKLSILDDMLGEVKSEMFVIRGNHDDPNWFKNITSVEITESRIKLKNIKFLEDYTCLNINDENVLFVGGALSIDRVHRRVRGMKWWNEEAVNFDFDFVKNLRGIDRVITHTAPDFVEPRRFGKIVYSFASNDDKLLDDLRTERENMSKMVQIIMSNNKIKGYYYGHFHDSYKFFHNGCSFIGLGVEEIIEM